MIINNRHLSHFYFCMKNKGYKHLIRLYVVFFKTFHLYCTRVSPENGQVGCLHQHVHQRIHHFCVKNDGVHHFSKLFVIGDAKTGFGNTGVGLRRERKKKYS